MKLKAAVITTTLFLAAPVSAGWFDAIKGNDTGGIVPWSPDLLQMLHPTAEAHCARYNKISFITSLPAKPGDYAAFVCAFPPGYDPVKASVAAWGR